VTEKDHIYVSEVEKRKEGGTPQIVGSIRAGLVFQLKNTIGEEFIAQRKHYFCQEAIQVLKDNSNIAILGNLDTERLPIISFMIRYQITFLHYHFVSVLLNDLFGIQVRGWRFLPQYIFYPDTGEWIHQQFRKFPSRKWISDLRYTDGKAHFSGDHVDIPSNLVLEDYFVEAQQFLENSTDFQNNNDMVTLPHLDDHNRHLKWFLFPSEAAAILRGKTLTLFSKSFFNTISTYFSKRNRISRFNQ